MSARHALESALAAVLVAGFRALPRRPSLAAGAAAGDLLRGLGVRRRVAAENLARAFPEWTPARRDAVLRAHYRELGRVAAEYARLPELAHAGDDLVTVRGGEHLEAARAAGRGVILMSGHFGNFELLGARLGRLHPTAFVVRAMSNPRVEARLVAMRTRAGVATIDAGRGVRAVYEELRANRWVAMLADQDARRHGVFVPFFGVPASTALGPARIALATGAPIVMGFDRRREDGGHELAIEPPLAVADPRAPDAAERLTALHVAALERAVRRQPESWFWLHRRWKTRPPSRSDSANPVAAGA